MRLKNPLNYKNINKDKILKFSILKLINLQIELA